MGKKGLPWLIGIAVFGVDFLIKSYVDTSIPLMETSSPDYPYGGIPVFRNFWGVELSITHATNTGAAWGLFAGYQMLLLWARMAMIGVLFYYAAFIERARQLRIPLALIIAGAVANVADVFCYGHVVDMLHFVLWGYDYPVFNVADSAICIGVCWVLFQNIFKKSDDDPDPHLSFVRRSDVVIHK